MITFRNLGNLGRLGNQLFQIAATINYARKYKQQVKFPEWWYSKHFNFNYECLNENIHIILNESDCLNYVQLPDYYPRSGNVSLNGYFQSEKYFIESKNEILDIFKTEETNLNCGFIHVRRSDYINLQNYHPLQSLEYYMTGMDRLKFDHYYCFSDDIQWCKENLNDSRIEFVENTSEIQDLKLMMRCKGSVIANSSFSWWGAYLSQSDKVIIPKNWFGPSYNWFRIEDRLCEKWIAL